ncbi:MAG TPA: queuosine salvage family protein [Candidatus Saccharimonadales bacterium]|nr:queuosine salvage family protein [Candidatus Saccharimonadales bacterium]
MLNVLKTTKFVVDNSQSVKINNANLKKMGASVTEKELKLSDLDLSSNNWNFNQLHYLTLVFNALVYNFWAEKDQPKWTIKTNKTTLDGSVALFLALEIEAQTNKDFFKPQYLANFSYENAKKLFKGNTEIPLFHNRVSCIRELGYVLKNKFSSNANKIIDVSNRDAVKVVEFLSETMPLFNDVRSYKGTKVGFYKRATLHAKMLNDLLKKYNKSQLKNMHKLTAIADYKIPQILRSVGIFEYSSDLAEHIDSYKIVNENSEYEVEIRAATIWAVKYLTHEINKKFPHIVAVDTDNILWKLSQNATPNFKPYHRTYTIDY